MRITLRQLKRLPVETKGGKKLGHVCNVIFEIDDQFVAQYEVSPSLLSGKKYLISRDQVTSISAEKMIVDDGVVRVSDEINVESKLKIGKVEPEGAAMRE